MIDRHHDSASCALARRVTRMLTEESDALPPEYPQASDGPDLRPRPPAVERVIRYVCAKYDIRRMALLSGSQSRTVTKARGEACRQLRELGLSFGEIAEHLNMKHHTSAIYHCSKGLAGTVNSESPNSGKEHEGTE
jgi:hypothetical protein